MKTNSEGMTEEKAREILDCCKKFGSGPFAAESIAAEAYLEAKEQDRKEMENLKALVSSYKLNAHIKETVIKHIEEKIKKKDEALREVRKYLEDRGIRKKGWIGRTIILPMIDEILGRKP